MKKTIVFATAIILLSFIAYAVDFNTITQVDKYILEINNNHGLVMKDYNEAQLAYEQAVDRGDWWDQQEREDDVDYYKDILEVIEDQQRILEEAKQLITDIQNKEDELRQARMSAGVSEQKRIQYDLNEMIDRLNIIEDDFDDAKTKIKELEERKTDYSEEEYFKKKIYETEDDIEELENQLKEYQDQYEKLEIALDDAERANDMDLRRDIKNQMMEIEDEMDDIRDDLTNERQKLLDLRNDLDEARKGATISPTQEMLEAKKLSEQNKALLPHQTKTTVKIEKEEKPEPKAESYYVLHKEYLNNKKIMGVIKHQYFDCLDNPREECASTEEEFIKKGRILVLNTADMVVARLNEIKGELESNGIENKEILLMKVNEKITKMQVAKENAIELSDTSEPSEISLAARSVRTVWRNSMLEIKEILIRNGMEKSENVLDKAERFQEKFEKINKAFLLQGKNITKLKQLEIKYEVQIEQTWKYLAKAEEDLQNYDIENAKENVKSSFSSLEELKSILAEIKASIQEIKSQEMDEAAKQRAIEYAEEELTKAFATGDSAQVEKARKNLIAIENS